LYFPTVEGFYNIKAFILGFEPINPLNVPPLYKMFETDNDSGVAIAKKENAHYHLPESFRMRQSIDNND